MSEEPRRTSVDGAEGVHERPYRFALARFEGWVLGLLASTGIGISYMLTNQNPAWLWVASALLLVQWFGDSLDGTLARVRGIERPRYGFYLDHITDAYSVFGLLLVRVARNLKTLGRLEPPGTRGR